MGIEMGMEIESTGMGGNGNFVLKKIPAPSDSYQIYNNSQIEFKQHRWAIALLLLSIAALI